MELVILVLIITFLTTKKTDVNQTNWAREHYGLYLTIVGIIFFLGLMLFWNILG